MVSSLQQDYPLWHPCAQMKDYENFPPLEVASAQGVWLILKDGRKLIDASASWWCKSLGHGHPRLRDALIKQAETLEHVLLANTCNDAVMECSRELTSLMPGLNKVFYASDGACAVEIAVKMSLQSQQIRKTGRTQLIALSHGYHGETLMASALSDCDLYSHAFDELFDCVHSIGKLPLVSGRHDPLWSDCSATWPEILAQLEPLADTAAAIVVEPVLQGAGGMRIYSPDLLKRLRAWADDHGVHLIADEILTGMGRVGEQFGCDLAQVTPDLMCLGKGLTAGWLPMSAVLISQSIFDDFYADYDQGRNFLHSHTYSGHALAAAVAAETLKVMREEHVIEQVAQLEREMLDLMQECVDASDGWLGNLRGVGGMVAVDLNHHGLPADARLGYAVYQRAVELGALLRPLGNTLYWMPPLNITSAELTQLAQITSQAVQEVTAGLGGDLAQQMLA